jgi:phage repressor protein C with HTH and peptisase S24 domain
MARNPKAPQTLTHEQIWSALDRLAERAGLSASGLAKKSGLDPTTFNKSKRVTADGRERWPSTESVARALAATDSSIDSFLQLVGDSATALRMVPLLGETELPCLRDEHIFALEISGDQMRPIYRDGDVIVVSPATPIRRGDRVVVKTTEGEIMVQELRRRTMKTLELQSLNQSQADRTLAVGEVAWIARIVWTSQ